MSYQYVTSKVLSSHTKHMRHSWQLYTDDNPSYSMVLLRMSRRKSGLSWLRTPSTRPTTQQSSASHMTSLSNNTSMLCMRPWKACLTTVSFGSSPFHKPKSSKNQKRSKCVVRNPISAQGFRERGKKKNSSSKYRFRCLQSLKVLTTGWSTEIVDVCESN